MGFIEDMGSVAGDIGSGISDYLKNLTGANTKEAQEAERKAAEAKAAQMTAAAGVYGDYRQQQQQARMNALASISTAYQPANNALATMYGGGMGGGSNYNARPAGYAPITAGMSGAAAPQQTFTAQNASTAPALRDLLGSAKSPTIDPRGNTASAQTQSSMLAKLAKSPALAGAARPTAPSVSQPGATPPGAPKTGLAAAPRLQQTASAARPTLTASQIGRAAEIKQQAGGMRTLEKTGLSGVGGIPTPGQTDASGNVGAGHVGEDGTYYTPQGIYYNGPGAGTKNMIAPRDPPPLMPGMSVDEANAQIPLRTDPVAGGKPVSWQYWVVPPGGDPSDQSTWVWVDGGFEVADPTGENRKAYHEWLRKQGLEPDPNGSPVGVPVKWAAAGSWVQDTAAAGGGAQPGIGAPGGMDPTAQYRTQVAPNMAPPGTQGLTGPAGVSFQPNQMLQNPFGNAAGADGFPAAAMMGGAPAGAPPVAAARPSLPPAAVSGLKDLLGVSNSPALGPGGSMAPAQNAGNTLAKLRQMARSGVTQKMGARP
jgi:hypothetical protein